MSDERVSKHPSAACFASSTPAVDASQVYVLWTEPERASIHALDHEGREVWNRDLGSYHTQHGGGASPIVAGDLVIVPLDQEQGGPARGGPEQTPRSAQPRGSITE